MTSFALSTGKEVLKNSNAHIVRNDQCASQNLDHTQMSQ